MVYFFVEIVESGEDQHCSMMANYFWAIGGILFITLQVSLLSKYSKVRNKILPIIFFPEKTKVPHAEQPKTSLPTYAPPIPLPISFRCCHQHLTFSLKYENSKKVQEDTLLSQNELRSKRTRLNICEFSLRS